MSELRRELSRGDADERLSSLLGMSVVRGDAASQAGGLLRLLLIR